MSSQMAYQFSHHTLTSERRYASSSPAPTPAGHHDDSPRRMNLRIHYTFDLRAESPCLARHQNPISVQSVPLADGSQIGEISLKTCLQAILKASPEIYSEETDYTVYVFDPSEHGTPRVGHGRLSQIIRSNDSSEDEQIMVMGVVKSGSRLLATAQQVQENLEVRLVLTPVGTRIQSDSGSRSPFLQERAASPRLAQYPDPSEVMNRLDPQYRMMLQNASSSSQTAVASTSAFDKFMADSSRPALSQENRPSTSSNFTSFSQIQPQPLSRPASPAMSVASNSSTTDRRSLKRTVSGVSRTTPLFISDIPGALDDYNSSEESGPKRARTIQAERPGKNVLNKKGDLRVVASSAASVRVHQPTAIRPQGPGAQNLEEPPRAPTPVPIGNHFLHRRTSAARSGLHAETSFSQTSDSRSPFSEVNLPSLPNSAATSPEMQFAQVVTPEDLASSPPVMSGFGNCPSSPALPPLPPLHDDSGFMSGSGLMDMSEVENLELDNQSPEAGSMPPPKKSKAKAGSRKKSKKVLQPSDANVSDSTLIHEQALSGAGVSRKTPPAPSAVPKQRGRPRGRPDAADEPKRSAWEKEKRRQSMILKLTNSIANGEIPPFCHNCGAIETLTWRKAWFKVHAGEPPTMVIPKGGVKEPGAIIGCEIIEQSAETGKATLFRAYKTTLLATDVNWEAIRLCNPCGLWMKTRGLNRPEKLWSKEDGEQPRKDDTRASEREKRPRMARGDEEPQSDTTEVVGSASGTSMGPPSLPKQLSTMSEPVRPSDAESSLQASGSSNIPSSQTHTSIEPKAANNQTQANKEKATPGSRTGPIDVDKGPSPVRRSLFSSPKSSGPLGVDIPSKTTTPIAISIEDNDQDSALEDNNEDDPTPHPQQDSTSQSPPERATTPSKTGLYLPPVTPRHATVAQDSSFSKTPSNLFKTPTSNSLQTPSHRITTSDFFSSSAKKLLHGAATLTPSRIGKSASPLPDSIRFSPHMPKILRSLYGTTPNDFSDLFDQIDDLDEDCCPGSLEHNDDCPRKQLLDPRLTEGLDLPLLTGVDFSDAAFTSDFPVADDDWTNADTFFRSSGITGFTPMKPMTESVLQDDGEA